MKIRKWVYWGFLCVLVCLPSKAASVSTARVYADKKMSDAIEGPPLYEIKTVEEVAGDKVTQRLTHVDREGKEFCSQIFVSEKGQPSEYTFTHIDVKGTAKIKITPTEVIFESVSEGETKTHRVPKPENLVVGPSINRFIAEHLADLREGKAVPLQMAVVHAMKIFGVELEKTGGEEPEVKNGTWLKLELKSPNFFIRTVMPQLLYYVDAKSGKVIAFAGPISARKSDGSKKGIIRYSVPKVD